MYAGVFLQFSCWMFACQVFMQVPGPFCWTWIVSKTKLGVWVQKIKHTRPQINWQFLVLRTQHCDSLMHFQDFQGETNYVSALKIHQFCGNCMELRDFPPQQTAGGPSKMPPGFCTTWSRMTLTWGWRWLDVGSWKFKHGTQKLGSHGWFVKVYCIFKNISIVIFLGFHVKFRRCS